MELGTGTGTLYREFRVLSVTCSASLTFHHHNIIIILRIPRSFYRDQSLQNYNNEGKLIEAHRFTGVFWGCSFAFWQRMLLSWAQHVCWGLWFFFFSFFLVGVFVFSLLTVLGSSIFALGSHFKGSPYLLPMMLTGRLLFGSGNGSLTSKEFIFFITPHQRVMMHFYFAS